MAASPNTAVRRPGPALWLSILLLILGIAGIVVSGLGVGRAVVHSILDAPVLTSPGKEQVLCRSGTYLLYVENGSSSLSATTASVTVTGPGGENIPVEAESTSQTFSKNGQQFSGALGFVASTAGTYTVSVHTSGSSVLVAPSFTTAAQENIGWIVGIFVSGILALVGFVLLIVGIVRRSRAKRAVPYGGAWGGPPGSAWPPQPGAPQGGAWPGAPQGPGWPAQPGAAPGGWPAQPGAAPGGWPAQPGWAPPPNAPGPPTGAPSPQWGQPPNAAPPPPGWPAGPQQASPPGSGGAGFPPSSAPSRSGPSSPGTDTQQSSADPSGWPRPSDKPPNRPG
jgi:hypothetical protein